MRQCQKLSYDRAPLRQLLEAAVTAYVNTTHSRYTFEFNEQKKVITFDTKHSFFEYLLWSCTDYRIFRHAIMATSSIS